MNRHTGRRIEGMEHLRQSVADILSTPIGSRVMRRDYGSLVPALLDQPDNTATQARLRAAVASALMRWEPRIRLTRIVIERDPAAPGRADLTLKDTAAHRSDRLLTMLGPTPPLTPASAYGAGGNGSLLALTTRLKTRHSCVLQRFRLGLQGLLLWPFSAPGAGAPDAEMPEEGGGRLRRPHEGDAAARVPPVRGRTRQPVAPRGSMHA